MYTTLNCSLMSWREVPSVGMHFVAGNTWEVDGFQATRQVTTL